MAETLMVRQSDKVEINFTTLRPQLSYDIIVTCEVMEYDGEIHTETITVFFENCPFTFDLSNVRNDEYNGAKVLENSIVYITVNTYS